MSTARQRGFTLIELVVVIVILGILSAFAVPRFMGLERQARIASLKALEGSLRSSANLAHSVSIASGGAHNAALTNVEGLGANLAMSFYYPTRGSIQQTLQDTTGFTMANNGASREFRRVGAPTTTTCTVTYTPPTANGQAPTFTRNETGC